MTPRRFFVLLLTLLTLLTLLAPSALSAEAPTTSALGNDGEIYRIVHGTYGDLFPGGDQTNSRNAVLAVDTAHPDGTSARFLVPRTLGGQDEQALGVVYNRAQSALTVLWQNDATASGKLLRLVTLSGGEWSDVTTLEDPTLAPIVRTRSLLTSDRYRVDIDDDENEEIVERTILHLVWMAEEGASIDVRYTPIIFLEGHFIGWNEVVSLRDLMVDVPLDPPAVMPRELELALALEGTRDGQRLQVAFASAASGELSVINIGVLPLELAYLSDEIRELLLGLEEHFDPQHLNPFANKAQLEIIGTGVRRKLHRPLVDYVAGEVRREILAVGAEYDGRFPELVEHLRQLSIDLTAPLVTTDLSFMPGIGDSQVLVIDVGDLLGGAAFPAQILDLHVLGSVPVPTVGDAPTTLHVAPNARDMIVAWDDAEAGAVHWVERQGDGWSEVRTLPLGDMSFSQAHDLLRQRAR